MPRLSIPKLIKYLEQLDREIAAKERQRESFQKLLIDAQLEEAFGTKETR